MSTIIRVKRRCDEEPQDVIVLNCKRRKINESPKDNVAENEENALQTLLQFAGTVNNQEDDVLKHCKTSLKESTIKSKSQTETTSALQSIRDRVREECYNSSKENRYKVVNLCRNNSQEDKEVTIIDVDTTTTQDCETSTNEATTSKYVYDLYYTTSDDLGEIYDHDLVGVYPLSNELVYGSHRDNGFLESDSDQSEDSNAENNWRNEYPDEDDCDNKSINEDDMLAAMKRVNLKGDDLSSDEEVEGFIYSIDSEAAGFEEDIDDSDVNRYGERYASFKARCKKAERDSVDDENFYLDYDDDDNDENRDEEAHSSYY